MYVCLNISFFLKVMYVCMYMSRYRTALSIVRDRQALQAEFLKSVIVGILIALILFGRLLFLQMYVCMYVCMRGVVW